MTRETKIGLLVGLAFIIVIGILLSDHLTSSTEPPPASLVAAGSNVRETVSVPGGAQPVVTPVVTPPQVTPQAPVPVTRDLQPQVPPTAVVQIGPPGAQPPTAQQSVQSASSQALPAQSESPAAQSPSAQPPITFAGETPAKTADAPSGAAQADIQVAGADAPNTALARIAQQHGEPVVTVTPGPAQQSQSASLAQHGSGTRQYVAEPGDSVSKMASKFLGANTRANRDAIIRLNPSLQQDPNKVIAGRTYQIPTNVAAPTSPAAPTAATAPPPNQQLASAGEYWYIVKENDSLWKIASEQLGNPAAVTAIKELNKETLKGSDVVHPNMRLRLPARPLARAN
ncbi:LysM peptidoglycan-binding domain-containing protein [Fontivita pretiosa]|uniref:LysM peptidoglycan-binding domain-containing protein n=1 Tax=Fontivita pretiosa TaxID=2989684 RepID=UPI003D183143